MSAALFGTTALPYEAVPAAELSPDFIVTIAPLTVVAPAIKGEVKSAAPYYPAGNYGLPWPPVADKPDYGSRSLRCRGRKTMRFGPHKVFLLL